MADRDLVEGTRLGVATEAWICFEGEVGQTLRPPKARTWARRGGTPVMAVSGKGSGRVPVAGLVCFKSGPGAACSTGCVSTAGARASVSAWQKPITPA